MCHIIVLVETMPATLVHVHCNNTLSTGIHVVMQGDKSRVCETNGSSKRKPRKGHFAEG